MALGEKGTGQEGASVLSVDIVVGVNENTPINTVAHGLASFNGIDQSVGHVVDRFGGAGKVGEQLGVAIAARRRGALEAIILLLEEPAQVAVLEPRQISERVWEVVGIVAIVPSRRRALLPGSERSTVGVARGEGVRGDCGVRSVRTVGAVVCTTDEEGGRDGYEKSREGRHCSRRT